MRRLTAPGIVILPACSADASSQTAFPADDSPDARPRLEPQQAIPPAELEAFVDGLVHQAMDAEHIAGASVSVVQSGRIVLEKGYGFADVALSRRIDPHTTMFRIGSITKTFTWIAVMNAIAAGRMSLDDPLNTHLPPHLQVPDEGFAEPIRIRHLMTHAPGFDDLMLGHVFETAARNVRPLAVYLQEERPRRVREPGRVSSYSNYGVAPAGAALEQITGREWQQIVEDTIVTPLGMRYTSAREPYPARRELQRLRTRMVSRPRFESSARKMGRRGLTRR
jgi:CubicO group peptidase (beta-lactamase class C family)